MAYPTTLDSLVRPSLADPFNTGASTGGPEIIDALSDALEAIEVFVGVSGSAVSSTVEYRVTNHVHTSLSPTTLIIPGATSPSQTAEGSMVWDTDDDVLTLGTSTGRKTLLNSDKLNGGTSTQNGAATVYNVPHSLGGTPVHYVVSAGSADAAAGHFWVSADATNLIVTFITATPAGAANIALRWMARAA